MTIGMAFSSQTPSSSRNFHGVLREECIEFREHHVQCIRRGGAEYLEFSLIQRPILYSVPSNHKMAERTEHFGMTTLKRSDRTFELGNVPRKRPGEQISTFRFECLQLLARFDQHNLDCVGQCVKGAKLRVAFVLLLTERTLEFFKAYCRAIKHVSECCKWHREPVDFQPISTQAELHLSGAAIGRANLDHEHHHDGRCRCQYRKETGEQRLILGHPGTEIGIGRKSEVPKRFLECVLPDRWVPRPNRINGCDRCDDRSDQYHGRQYDQSPLGSGYGLIVHRQEFQTHICIDLLYRKMTVSGRGMIQ